MGQRRSMRFMEPTMYSVLWERSVMCLKKPPAKGRQDTVLPLNGSVNRDPPKSVALDYTKALVSDP